MEPRVDGSGVGFPHPKPTLSFWLQGTRNNALIGHRTTEEVPSNADVVIIGAGMSGAATAYHLLKDHETTKGGLPKVVMLEAREVCYGATGRNGGHCKPDFYRGYPKYKKRFGKDEAMKILQNEKETLALLTRVVEDEKIDCDLWRGRAFDVALNEACAEDFHAALQEFAADGGEVDGIIEWISSPQEAKRRTRCVHAHAAAAYPTGSFWPYKFVTSLLRLCIDKYSLNVQTDTPVLSVSRSGNGKWVVETARGSVQAAKVVFGTNAYTSTLLPEFTGKIVPVRGQCSVVIPTKAYSGERLLTHTYSLRWRMLDSDYLIQRPSDGAVIVGGGEWNAPLEDQLGQTDDSVTHPAITKHLRNVCAKNFEGWGEEAQGEGLITDWTGIMGETPDSVPFVGELEERRGCFICAGHNGHGMARIMSCARGVATLVSGGTWEDTGLPECFKPTAGRIKNELQVRAEWAGF
ncbi:FAD dependent oxidoreductase [Thelephora terrestris]|uniref:FAD dependent oxidoreductase n=1 Tax=Thelephora terrestris TaxID=56493 RepID=A0A9P6HQD3_9AGAM|nr:FAD dependent oxidoreductase [Thelephora terrestris]